MLITFEGPDGSVKSTQAKLLKDRLEKDGHKVTLVHFPRYESPIGNFINKILKGEEKIDFKAMQMIYVADQLDFQKELKEKLSNNEIVICDRYNISTIAFYMSHYNCSVEEAINKVYNNWQVDLELPNLTFLLDTNGNIVSKRREEETFDILEKDKTLMNNVAKNLKEVTKFLDTNLFLNAEYIEADDDIDTISDDIYNKFNLTYGYYKNIYDQE